MTENSVDIWNRIEHDSDMMYISIEVTGDCNHNCGYCYVNGKRLGELTLDELEGITDQATKLGLEKIQISGGEPLMHPSIWEFFSHLKKRGIISLLATNGAFITERDAKQLYELNVTPGLSLQSIDEEVCDELTGTEGSCRQKIRAVNNLRKAGYGHGRPFNVIIPTLKRNRETFVDTWKWALSIGAEPILDRAIPGGRCRVESVYSPAELKQVLDELGKIHGIEHKVPFSFNEACTRLGYSVHITIHKDVYPCAGIPLSIGNLEYQSLAEIWKDSSILRQLRDYRSNLKGTCGTCVENKICNGCRAIPYHVFGDLFGPDPLCFRYRG